MAKKLIPKALSAGLSLTLCAALVVPSFVASFSDLQDAINSKSGRNTITYPLRGVRRY